MWKWAETLKSLFEEMVNK